MSSTLLPSSRSGSTSFAVDVRSSPGVESPYGSGMRWYLGFSSSRNAVTCSRVHVVLKAVSATVRRPSRAPSTELPAPARHDLRNGARAGSGISALESCPDTGLREKCPAWW